MDKRVVQIIKIFDTAGYKTVQIFSTDRRFILDILVTTWFSTLSYLGTSLFIPILAVPYLPFLLWGPWM